MENLCEIIHLINSNKEGVYWDFKQEHHKNKIDLIHDIICLANADHNGDRYLIYGITNQYKIEGISNDTNRRKQSDIIDTLRNANFTGDIYPDISLNTIQLGDKALDIIIIKNTTEKPYYLSKEKSCSGRKISAGTIYSRTMDTNTPINSVAKPNQIERMWRERFGLLLSPLEKLSLYIEKFNDWISHDDNYEKYYYKYFPEYTYSRGDYNTRSYHNCVWARGEISPDDKKGTYEVNFYYHQTLIFKLHVCYFYWSEDRSDMVQPEVIFFNGGEFYYYLMDSIKYKFQRHLFLKNLDDVQVYDRSNRLRFVNNDGKCTGEFFELPTFKNESQLEEFIRKRSEKYVLAKVI